jgi:hypothetical protein
MDNWIKRTTLIAQIATVLGVICVGCLRFLAVLARVLGGLANNLSKILINIYDLVIMVPLTLERFISSQQSRAKASGQPYENSDLEAFTSNELSEEKLS